MVLGSFSFACMGTLTHEVGAVLDWQVAAMVRSLIPFLLVLAFALVTRARLVFWRPRVLWIRSIAGSLSLLATFFALSCLPVPDVFTITNIFPVWVALLSWPVNGSIPSVAVWLSVASGVAGVVVIGQPHLDQGNWAILAALAASIFTAVAMMGLNRLHHVDVRAVVVHFSGVSFCFALAAYFAFDHAPLEPVWPDLPIAVKLLGVGIAATVGQIFLTKAFTHGDPAKVSVVGLSQVGWALLLDILVLGHPPEGYRLIGIPLVLAPTAWMMWLERGKAPFTGDPGGVADAEEEDPFSLQGQQPDADLKAAEGLGMTEKRPS